MTTAEEYIDISKEAYLVDPLRQDPPMAKGNRFYAGSEANEQLYEVVDVQNNPGNGFQAMAVAPVVNDEPDTSQITVSYAGTNPNHRADILADIQSIVGDQRGPGTQLMDAQLFAERVARAHPDATIDTTGHSLGAFLALLVAAENGFTATTFNGPDPWEWLSPEAKERLRKAKADGRKPLRNYVNVWDLVGNIYPDKTGAADFVTDVPGRPTFDYHNIENGESFTINPDGSIKGAGAKGKSLEEIVANAADTFAPGLAGALGPGLTGLVTSMRNPTFMRSVGMNASGVIVAVNTVSALGLAASIQGTLTSLMEIKSANARLVPSMEAGLLAAKNAATMLPFITTYDIENCVEMNRLHVHQNIDERAVDEVDRLVNDHMVKVTDLSEGISRAVTNAMAQDAQWAVAYATQ